MSFELVLLVPVLVLLTVFVLWAGRGGRVALTADLAAEEAATAAALCCEEGDAGGPDRDVLVEDMLEARPGLEFLCVGGVRPEAPAEDGVGPDGFVGESWLEFEPGSGARSGGVGVLGVRFSCETDGAVAPLRGLFPTVTFHGQASEVVVRRPPPPNVGFESTVFRVNEHETELVLVITSPTPVPQDIRVDYVVSSADPNLNYTLPSPGSVTMTDGTNSASIRVVLDEGDTLHEGTETLSLALVLLTDPSTGNAVPATVAELDPDRTTATGEVEDDDPPPYLFVSSAASPCQVTEGGAVAFEVRLRAQDNNGPAPSASTVTVDATTEDDTAEEAANDYTALSLTTLTGNPVTFNPGDDTVTVTVQTLDDSSSPVGEPTETFKVVLANANGAPLGDVTEVTCEIVDDEVRVTVADAAVDEGDQLTFQLSLDRAPSADITVDYRLVDHNRATHPAERGSGCAGAADYLELSGSITIRYPHDHRQAVDLPAVTTCEDVLVEHAETFWLEISIPAGGGEAVVEPGAGAIGTIRDDDIPTVSIVADPADATGTEGQTEPLKFTVSLTVNGQPAQLSENITVDYALGGIAATATAPGLAGADYAVTLDTAVPAGLSGSTLSGRLAFTAATSGVAAVTEHIFEAELLADHLVEGDETFVLDLDNLIDPVSAAVFEDTDGDPNTDDSHIGATIVDDPPPVLSVGDFRGDEGSDQSFTVTLANPRAGGTVTVDYVIAGAGTDPATDPAAGETRHDYTAASGSLSGTLTFPDGAASLPDGSLQHSVGVSLHRDAINEADETLRLVLSDPVRAVLADRDPVAVGVQAYGEGTIVNDDAPWLSVDNATAREGEPLTFTVTLCNPIPGEDVTVSYQTQPHSAAAGRDFVADGGTLTFLDTLAVRPVSEGCGAGVTADAKSLPVQVETLNDSVEESDEEVHLVLSGQMPDHVGLGKSIGVGRIINVSAATVRVSNPTAVEGSPLVFTISLVDNDGNPAVITAPVTVHYETADRTATAGAACNIAGTDYVAPSAGSFTFQPTDTVRAHPVPVATCADLEDEDDETVALVLRLADGTDNAGLGDTEGTGTIEDADPPSLRILDADAQEGQTMTFEVVLVNSNGVETSTSEDVTVSAATEDGTATAGADYTATSRQMTIPAGATRVSVPFAVATIIDDINEPSETFRVVLTGATNAKLDRAFAIGTINPRCVDINVDDADNRPPTITVHDSEHLEGEGFTDVLSFSRPLCDDYWLVLRYMTGNAYGTATWGSDIGSSYTMDQEHFDTVTRLASSSEGSRRQFSSFSSQEDDLDEDDEWLTVQYRWGSMMPDHYPKGGTDWFSGRVTILDDDDPPSLSVADAAADEGDPIAFTVALDRASGLPVTVQYRTVPASGTATGGTDYTEVGWTTQTFMPGERFATFDVSTADDGPGDSGETFLVELRAPVSADPANPAPPLNAFIVDGVAVGTILEGDLPEMRIFDASADENSTMGLAVELSEAATQTVTVEYSTVERPEDLRAADEGADYVRVSDATLVFQPGETEKFAEVVLNADAVPEVDETFLVELSNPNGAALADPSAVGTINGDVTCVDLTDPDAPVVTASSPTAEEGDGQITFTLTANRPACQTNRIDVVWDRQGTARPGLDYHLVRLDTRIPALSTEVTFHVELIDDDIDEPDEEIRVGLWLISTGGSLTAVGTILDDDQAALSVAGDSGPEGGFLNFVIRLDGPSDRTVTVDYATEDTTPPSAEAGTDYRARSSTAVIAEGELSATVAVFAPQDGLDEDAETFLLRLGNPTGGASLADADAVATGTITDDDTPPSLRVSDASAEEGETLEFVVTLSVPSGRQVSVPVATRDDSATAGDDYVALAVADLVFAPGETRQTVRVRTLADSVVESAEIVWLDLGPMRNSTATIGDGLGRGVIRDISDRRVSVSDAFVVEGGTLAFEVGFSEGPSSRDVIVRYRTRAGTASAGGDYEDDFESAMRELKIVAGETSATVFVPTVDDGLDEDNETLELMLSSPAGAVIVGSTASGVIIDNDPEPALSVSDTEATEADGASASFTLALSEASGRDVTVTYSTADVTATAVADYTPPAAGAMETITAGSTTATVSVALVNDDDAENVETFRLDVAGAVNAQRDDSVGVATIIDDDGLVQILVDDPDSVYEGDGASVVFTVRLSRADGTNPVTVAYSTADGTATAGSDYTAATLQTLTFAATDTVKTVSVPLINDDVVEDSETFRLVLSSPSSNADLGDDQATVLILDDDSLPTLSVADAAAQTEGSTATFTVTLSRAVPQEVTVDYATLVDPTAAAEAAAAPGLDYTATSGTLSFAARATEATTTVPLLDDSFDEHTETFWLRVSSPIGATIVDGTATGTIDDDDPLSELSILDAGATEGSPLSFEVRLTPVSGRTVTVSWATEALPAGVDSASPAEDYTPASGALTFSPGTTTARVEVVSLPDDVSEADETFLVQLGTPANAALDDSAAVGAIRDDDGLPRISIADTTVDEDAGPAIFSVTLSHPSSQPVTVGYSTADGTAHSPPADPHDYAPDVVRTLTIPAAFTAGEISVSIVDDDLAEGTETFTITLTDPVNAVIAEGAGTATGYILDDEGQPRLSVGDAQECEDGSSTADCEVRTCRNNASSGGWTSYDHYLACESIVLAPGACPEGMCGGDGILEFSVQLSHASAEETSVRYATFASSAASPRDYVATTGTLTIPIGDTTASIPVTLVNDGVDERETETFLLVLDNPAGLELATEEATGTILDDDPLPRVSAQPFDALLANENDGFAYHRVTLSHPSDLTATVDYSFEYVGDRSPFAGVDDTPGTITFAPGVVGQTIEVPLFDNNVATYTSSQSFGYANTFYRIALGDPVNASRRLTTGAGVVWDDETPPYVNSVVALDVLESAGSATFTITLNRFSDTAATATYRTADGTASAGSDYTATEATVTFPAGTLTAEVSVPILDDTDIESDETLTLSIIDDPRNSNLTYLAGPLPYDEGGSGSGTVTILDDDTTLVISVADTSANENAGTMPFWVALSRAGATNVTVRYTTSDGTATAGSDYTAADRTLTIEAGATGAAVPVTILDDSDDTESDETFTLTLSNASGAGLATDGTTATATIIEDSDLPTITMPDNSRSESRSLYSRHLYFQARLSETTTRDVYVNWEVVEVPSLGDEAASVGSDFFPTAASNTLTSPTSGVLRFYPGLDYANIVFEIVADVIPERDERFQIILSNPQGALLEDSLAWGTIENDDLPIVTVFDAQASEADDAAVVFTLQLHAPGLDPASLDYTTVVRTSEGDRAARPGDDYTTASGTLNIPAGTTTATISVPIIADTADEEDETFLLVLTNPDSLEFRDRVAVGTIVDDDTGFWIRDRSVWENAATMDFTVQRDHTSASPATVNYRIGTGGSATGGTACTDDGADYKTPYTTPPGTVTMPAAATEAAISIEICNDDDAEGRENLLIELTNVTGRKTTGVGTIVDDDRTDLPRINISDSSVRTETVHATLGAQFQISADGPLTDTVTVTWRTENCLATDSQCPNPATAGDDYTASSGTVTLTPTANSATVTVAVLNDTTVEDSEQFFVRITAVTGPAVVGSGVTHADPVGIGFITDDDARTCINPTDSSQSPPTLTASVDDVEEGSTVIVSAGISGQLPFCDGVSGSLIFWAREGTASSADYTISATDRSAPSTAGLNVPGMGELAAGILRVLASGTVDDTDQEGDETFTLFMTWGDNLPQRYQDATPLEIIVTIRDND